MINSIRDYTTYERSWVYENELYWKKHGGN